jgi:hypothetical protein
MIRPSLINAKTWNMFKVYFCKGFREINWNKASYILGQKLILIISENY